MSKENIEGLMCEVEKVFKDSTYTGWGEILVQLQEYITDLQSLQPNLNTLKQEILDEFVKVGPHFYQRCLQKSQCTNEESVLINYNELDNSFYLTTHIVANIGEDTEHIHNVEYEISIETVKSLLQGGE